MWATRRLFEFAIAVAALRRAPAVSTELRESSGAQDGNTRIARQFILIFGRCDPLSLLPTEGISGSTFPGRASIEEHYAISPTSLCLIEGAIRAVDQLIGVDG